MDHWAPVVRYPPDGTGRLVADNSAFQVGSGRFRCTQTATDTAAHGTGAATWLDAYGEIVVFTAGTTTAVRWGCWLRVADASNYYTCYGDGSGAFTIAKVVAGSTTSLLTGALSLAAGSVPGVFRAEIAGGTLRCFWRGRHLGSVDDTEIAGPGFVSMFLRVPASATDGEIARFEAGPLTASYSPGVEAQQAGPGLRHARLR